MTSYPPDPPSPVNEELENELDNFITLQQQLQNPNTLTIHHLSQTITSSQSSNPASTNEETRDHLVFKRKHHNNPMLPKPRLPRMFYLHPLHTNTKDFLPFFPQYTYYQTTNNDQRTYVDKLALFPTLPWTSCYHFTNPLSLPLYNNQEDSELCHTRLYHVTTALHEKQFTAIGLTQTLNRFVAQKANRFSINHYDHPIARYMEATFLEDDTNASPQLSEKFFIKSQYVFVINCMNTEYDNVIFTALCDTKTYDSYLIKFNHFLYFSIS